MIQTQSDSRFATISDDDKMARHLIYCTVLRSYHGDVLYYIRIRIVLFYIRIMEI
jgi:hypothetical protein